MNAVVSTATGTLLHGGGNSVCVAEVGWDVVFDEDEEENVGKGGIGVGTTGTVTCCCLGGWRPTSDSRDAAPTSGLQSVSNVSHRRWRRCTYLFSTTSEERLLATEARRW